MKEKVFSINMIKSVFHRLCGHKEKSRARQSGWLCLAALLCLGLADCGGKPASKAEASQEGRVVIKYWEKWTGFELEAMQTIVDRYNASQDLVFVQLLGTSEMAQKLLLATAGRNPPDVAGFWPYHLLIYAEKGALMPLNRFMQEDGLSMERYLPVVSDMCQSHGLAWGLPTTPATLALHYNKTLFRQAGLDPERPPQTLAELDDYAQRLTVRNERGEITQMGFNPLDPGWWNPFWIYWFGGEFWNGTDRLTFDGPLGVQAYQWALSYAQRYGIDQLQVLNTGDSNFASSQNMFISGKLAMQLQGMWMGNFIQKYNPQMDWGVAPFPAADPSLAGVSIFDCDLLVIPKGCKHPKEAWDFIKFTQRQENLEALNLAQGKFSPLIQVSEDFYRQHGNPYVRVFRQLAESPNVHGFEKLPVMRECQDELNAAFMRMMLGRATARQALESSCQRMQGKLERQLHQWERVKDERIKEWHNQ